MAKTFCAPPFRRGKTSCAPPPSRFVAPPPLPVISDQSLMEHVKSVVYFAEFQFHSYISSGLNVGTFHVICQYLHLVIWGGGLQK